MPTPTAQHIKSVLKIITAVILSGTAVTHAKDIRAAQQEFLLKIRAPQDLVAPLLPRAYTVKVDMSGSVAEEMRRTLKDLNLDVPEYIETFDRKNGFSLQLANDCYASETRDLLAGILNPIDMIDVVLRSIVRYRQSDLLQSLLLETQPQRSIRIVDGKAKWIVRLVPTGERFGYAYEDLGAYIQETWLTSMVIVVDSATMLAEHLDINKYACLFSADNPDRPSPSAKRYQYDFTYGTVSGLPVPVKLALRICDAPTLIVEASYRTEENSIVFDTRSICYHLADKTSSCLLLKYGKYTLNPDFPVLKIKGNDNDRARKVTQAAALAAKASEALKSGKIELAERTLRTIVQSYDGTPQAVEAKKLLDGLPEGL